MVVPFLNPPEREKKPFLFLSYLMLYETLNVIKTLTDTMLKDPVHPETGNI